METNTTNIPENLVNLVDQFNVIPKYLPYIRETLYLVYPKRMGVDWNNDNLIYRSSVWNESGELVSAGFPKFFNWGEKPELSPVPLSLDNAKVYEKLDGSLLILSKYKGQIILRTRGTINASTLTNGVELEIFKRTILPKLNDNKDTWDVSYLFEWVSNNNQIIIKYPDAPKFKLIGAIVHDNYGLVDQNYLDYYANTLGLERPKRFNFNNVSVLYSDVSKWEGMEGVVVYSNADQTIHKVKSTWYLRLHQIKSELSSNQKLLTLWVSHGMPTYDEFYNYILNTFDYELAEFVKTSIQHIVELKSLYDATICDIRVFLASMGNSYSKKDIAIEIINKYRPMKIESLAFNVFNNKLTDDTCYKFILERISKNNT